MAARNIPEINAGSMADIAFLLLIFFLVTTTMDIDTGITRKLPPPVENPDEDMDIKERNVFKVLVNSSNRLLVEGEAGDIRTLKDKTKEFIMNPANRVDLPEKKMEVIPFLGEVMVSKGIVSLKNDRGTSYAMYIHVQDELTNAFKELRDDASIKYFGVKFKNLVDEEKRKAIRKAIPMAISEAEPEDVGGQ